MERRWRLLPTSTTSALPRPQGSVPPNRRVGSREPRIFTPPLRPLEPRTAETEQHTLGYLAIDFARTSLKIDPYPWQCWFLIHLLELVEGRLRWRTALLLVARQNGKSTISIILALFFMLVMDWPLVLGTAQDLDVAEEIWQEGVDIVTDEDENPQLEKLVDKVIQVNGKKALVIKTPSRKGGNRWKVKAANRRAGRGLTGNLVLLDELREQQNWFAWAAITKTTIARANALILGMSNAGDITSVVLRHLRLVGHKALGDPDGICEAEAAQGPTQFDLDDVNDLVLDVTDDHVEHQILGDLELADLAADPEQIFLAEWSAVPDCDIRDRDQWPFANPSLGHGELTEANIASFLSEPEWVFRAETLCQWPPISEAGPFAPGTWELGQNTPIIGPTGRPIPAPEDRIVGPVSIGIAQARNRSLTYIARAGYRADGIAQVELVASRYGSEWIEDWFRQRSHRIVEIAGQTRAAPISPQLKRLSEDDQFNIPIVEFAGTDLLNAHSEVYDAVRDVKVRHHLQPALDRAAAMTVPKILAGGGGWVLDRAKSPIDPAPLEAFIAAHWLLSRHKPTPPPPSKPPEAIASTDSGSMFDTEENLNSVGF